MAQDSNSKLERLERDLEEFYGDVDLTEETGVVDDVEGLGGLEQQQDLVLTTQRPGPGGGAHRLSRGAQEGPINEFIPPGGWGDWEKAMYMEGRVHQTLGALADHTIVFDLVPGEISSTKATKKVEAPSTAAESKTPLTPVGAGGSSSRLNPLQPKGPSISKPSSQTQNTEPEMIEDVESCEYCQSIADRVDLLTNLRTIHKHRNSHRYGVLYPIFETLDDGSPGEVKKLKIFDSTKIRVIRDTYEDLQDLYQWFPNIPAKLVEMGRPEPRPDYTGRIVGFAFDFGTEALKHLQDAKGKEVEPDRLMRMRGDEPEVSLEYGKIFYHDDELIVFFRESSGEYPDGISLLRANYTILENKLSVDILTALGFSKTVLPTWIIRLVEGMAKVKKKVRRELEKARHSTGSDIILGGKKEDIDIEKTIADGLSNFGFILDYFEKQYNASMGVFDTMFTSVGANRATAYIQSELFDKRVQPDRLEIERTINKRFFEPLLRRHYGLNKQTVPSGGEVVVDKVEPRQYALPKWNWKSLVGDDAIDLAAALNPYQDNMAQNQVDYVLEKIMSLPARDGDTVGSQKIAAGKDALGQVRISVPPTGIGTGIPIAPVPVPTAEVKTPPEKTKLSDDDLGLSLDERREKKGKKALEKGGHIIPIKDNYVLYDPNEEI
jgi:hypothetical protein